MPQQLLFKLVSQSFDLNGHETLAQNRLNQIGLSLRLHTVPLQRTHGAAATGDRSAAKQQSQAESKGRKALGSTEKLVSSR